MTIKAGDQVWHHDTNAEIRVAAVDTDTGELVGDGAEQWVPVVACTKQVDASFEDHKATLIKFARSGGRRGIVARRQLARLWSEGKLGKAG